LLSRRKGGEAFCLAKQEWSSASQADAKNHLQISAGAFKLID
jgi:hypothetical protein